MSEWVFRRRDRSATSAHPLATSTPASPGEADRGAADQMRMAQPVPPVAVKRRKGCTAIA